jgi:hypothetical protein
MARLGVCLVCSDKCAAKVQFVRRTEHSGPLVPVADDARFYSRLTRLGLFVLQSRSSSRHSLSQSRISVVWSHLLSRFLHHSLLLRRLSAHRRSQFRLASAQSHLRRSVGLCCLAASRRRAHRSALGRRLDALVVRHFRADSRRLLVVHCRNQRCLCHCHALRGALYRLGHGRRRRPPARLARLQAAGLQRRLDAHCARARRFVALDLQRYAGRVQFRRAPRHGADRVVLGDHGAARHAGADAVAATGASANATNSARLRSVSGPDGRVLEAVRPPTVLSVHVLGQLVDQRDLLLLHARRVPRVCAVPTYGLRVVQLADALARHAGVVQLLREQLRRQPPKLHHTAVADVHAHLRESLALQSVGQSVQSADGRRHDHAGADPVADADTAADAAPANAARHHACADAATDATTDAATDAAPDAVANAGAVAAADAATNAGAHRAADAATGVRRRHASRIGAVRRRRVLRHRLPLPRRICTVSRGDGPLRCRRVLHRHDEHVPGR